jgi:hypothetical protein
MVLRQKAATSTTVTAEFGTIIIKVSDRDTKGALGVSTKEGGVSGRSERKIIHRGRSSCREARLGSMALATATPLNVQPPVQVQRSERVQSSATTKLRDTARIFATRTKLSYRTEGKYLREKSGRSKIMSEKTGKRFDRNWRRSSGRLWTGPPSFCNMDFSLRGRKRQLLLSKMLLELSAFVQYMLSSPGREIDPDVLVVLSVGGIGVLAEGDTADNGVDNGVDGGTVSGKVWSMRRREKNNKFEKGVQPVQRTENFDLILQSIVRDYNMRRVTYMARDVFNFQRTFTSHVSSSFTARSKTARAHNMCSWFTVSQSIPFALFHCSRPFSS